MIPAGAGVGSRSVFNVGFPLRALDTAVKSGLLPKLDQTKAPVGIDFGYDIWSIGPQESEAAALSAIKAKGGLPVVAFEEPKKVSLFDQIVGPLGVLASFFTVGGGVASTLKAVSTPDALAPQSKTLGFATLKPTGGNMAFQDGDSGFFGGIGDVFSGINNVLQANGQNLLNLGFNAANSFVQSQFAPQPVSYGGGGMAQPTMAAVPAVIGAGRAVATVGRGFFTRFPNLATAIQSLRNRGSNVTRGSLYSAMRRFGPEMLVTGGIMSAAAVSELAVAGPGRRRMNPGNVKALRRAHRRMKSFHRVCVDNDQLIRRRRK